MSYSVQLSTSIMRIARNLASVLSESIQKDCILRIFLGSCSFFLLILIMLIDGTLDFTCYTGILPQSYLNFNNFWNLILRQDLGKFSRIGSDLTLSVPVLNSETRRTHRSMKLIYLFVCLLRICLFLNQGLAVHSRLSSFSETCCLRANLLLFRSTKHLTLYFKLPDIVNQ